MATLSEGQVGDLLRAAGFSEDKIPLFINIARRESGFRSDAHNPNAATGDNSYGLFQINMIGDLGPARLREFADLGVRSYEDLKDPWKNAQAAKRVFDSSGPGAWTTAGLAAADSLPTATSAGGFGSMRQAGTPLASTSAGGTPTPTRSGDPLADVALAIAGGESPAKGGLEAFSTPRFAAEEPLAVALTQLMPETPKQTQQIVAALEPSQGGAGLEVVEYLTGDKSHPGYRDDHGGSNYHDHLAFRTKDQRDAAMAKLKAHGIQIGSVNDGKHAPGSYHYADLAFDVPAAQVPVGQEQELSRRVRKALGLA